MIERTEILARRVRGLTWLFIAGLVISGATAIPLESELNHLANWIGPLSNADGQPVSALTAWVLKVSEALTHTNAAYPFLAYGTDWLAFGHFVIAVAFLGAVRDPVRNVWLYQFGMIACALVIPYALIFGGLRGIPLGWRLIDCSFGIGGFIPLWCCLRWTLELARSQKTNV